MDTESPYWGTGVRSPGFEPYASPTLPPVTSRFATTQAYQDAPQLPKYSSLYYDADSEPAAPATKAPTPPASSSTYNPRLPAYAALAYPTNTNTPATASTRPYGSRAPTSQPPKAKVGLAHALSDALSSAEDQARRLVEFKSSLEWRKVEMRYEEARRGLGTRTIQRSWRGHRGRLEAGERRVRFAKAYNELEYASRLLLAEDQSFRVYLIERQELEYITMFIHLNNLLLSEMDGRRRFRTEEAARWKGLLRLEREGRAELPPPKAPRVVHGSPVVGKLSPTSCYLGEGEDYVIEQSDPYSETWGPPVVRTLTTQPAVTMGSLFGSTSVPMKMVISPAKSPSPPPARVPAHTASMTASVPVPPSPYDTESIHLQSGEAVDRQLVQTCRESELQVFSEWLGQTLDVFTWRRDLLRVYVGDSLKHRHCPVGAKGEHAHSMYLPPIPGCPLFDPPPRSFTPRKPESRGGRPVLRPPPSRMGTTIGFVAQPFGTTSWRDVGTELDVPPPPTCVGMKVTVLSRPEWVTVFLLQKREAARRDWIDLEMRSQFLVTTSRAEASERELIGASESDSRAALVLLEVQRREMASRFKMQKSFVFSLEGTLRRELEVWERSGAYELRHQKAQIFHRAFHGQE